MGSGSHCPHRLFVRIIQNLLTSWSAFRLAPDPIKSILYTEARMIPPKIYKFNQVTETLEMPWLMFGILMQSTWLLLWKTEVIICPLCTLDCLQLLSTDTSFLHSVVPYSTLGSLIMLASLLYILEVKILDSDGFTLHYSSMILWLYDLG